jgi:predicted MFS family arabinose efflux permease
MTAATVAPLPGRPAFPVFIAGLSVKQILSWGTTYYLPSILEKQISAELGLEREVVFGGITLMLAMAALIAPFSGKWIDRHGARTPMIIGTYCLAIGLCLIGFAQGLWTYLIGWVFFGLAVPLTMGIAALAAVAQTYPERGRAGITTLMLFGGLSSGLMWPLAGWLEARYGWRATCLTFAVMQVTIALPAAYWLVPKLQQPTDGADPRKIVEPRLLPQDRKRAFWLLILGSGVSGLVTWGLPLYFVPMLREAGMAAGLAIAIASLQAYFTFAARAFDLTMASRLGGMRIVAGGALLPPLVFVLLLWGMGGQPPGTLQTATFAVALSLYGFAAGLVAQGRATLPLELFGSVGYATTLGKLSFWLNIMFATSPLLFAFIFDRAGASAALTMGLTLSLIAAIAFWRLDRLVEAGERE